MIEREAALIWARQQIGAPYSREQRWSTNPPKFDCSSLVYRAFSNGAGVRLIDSRNGNDATTSTTQPYCVNGNLLYPEKYSEIGQLTPPGNLLTSMRLMPGDMIFYKTSGAIADSSRPNNIGHVAFFNGGNEIFHTANKRENACYKSITYMASSVAAVVRYGSGETPGGSAEGGEMDLTEVREDRILTLEEMKINATIFCYCMIYFGFSLQSIAAMLGNFESESSINPARNQVGGPGYGLAQWDPPSKYIDWAIATGYPTVTEYARIKPQTERLNYEFSNGIQYYPNFISGNNWTHITASEFKTGDYSPEDLAWAFLYNYERPANFNQPERATQARFWYEFLSNEYEEPGTDPTDDVPPSDFSFLNTLTNWYKRLF